MPNEQYNDLKERLGKIEDALSRLETAVLGVQGNGGLHRWVTTLDEKVDELMGFKFRILGIATGVSVLIGLLFKFIK